MWKAINAPLRHKGAPLPTLYPLCITVARQGQKFAFRDLNIQENFLFLKKKRCMFYFKRALLLRKRACHFSLRKRALLTKKKGHFLGVGNWGGGGHVPPPPPPGSAALVCPVFYLSHTLDVPLFKPLSIPESDLPCFSQSRTSWKGPPIGPIQTTPLPIKVLKKKLPKDPKPIWFRSSMLAKHLPALTLNWTELNLFTPETWSKHWLPSPIIS